MKNCKNKKNYNSIYFTLVILIFCTYCKAQTPKQNVQFKTDNLTTLFKANKSVRTIKQDRKGDIWIVSMEGIIRYNGKSFSNITSKLGQAKFWNVLEDKRGNFWLASVGSGVYYYDGKSFKNYTTKDGLSSNSVFEIYEDRAGMIWFGTGNGPSRYDGKSFQNFELKEIPAPASTDSTRSFYHYTSDPQSYWMVNETINRVHTIVEDKAGKVWFGTWGDVGIYDGKTYTSLNSKYSKTFTNVRSIIEDKSGNIWLNGGNGLLRYDGKAFITVPQRGGGYMIQDAKGNIWTTGEVDRDKGIWALSRYDAKSLHNKKPVITEITKSANGLFGVMQAKDGRIWFGGIEGVYRYDGKTVKKL